MPRRVATVDESTAGWRFTPDEDENEIELWWRVPPVWDSLDPVERRIWGNEEPFASRLWDFDLTYQVQIQRQGILFPLLLVRSIPPDPVEVPRAPGPPPEVKFRVQSAGTFFFASAKGSVELLEPIRLASKFRPELSVRIKVRDNLARWMRVEDLVLDLRVARPYGRGEPTITPLREKRRASEEEAA